MGGFSESPVAVPARPLLGRRAGSASAECHDAAPLGQRVPRRIPIGFALFPFWGRKGLNLGEHPFDNANCVFSNLFLLIV